MYSTVDCGLALNLGCCDCVASWVVAWRWQGGEDVLVCRRGRNGDVAIRSYYNGMRGSAPFYRDDKHLHDKQWESRDGRLSCPLPPLEGGRQASTAPRSNTPP